MVQNHLFLYYVRNVFLAPSSDWATYTCDCKQHSAKLWTQWNLATRQLLPCRESDDDTAHQLIGSSLSLWDTLCSSSRKVSNTILTSDFRRKKKKKYSLACYHERFQDTALAPTWKFAWLHVQKLDVYQWFLWLNWCGLPSHFCQRLSSMSFSRTPIFWGLGKDLEEEFSE